MPQSNTGNWKVKDIPYGKGSLHGQTVEATVRHWRRATKINEAENYRCHQITTLLEKYHKAADNRKERVMQRLRHSLEELEAYKTVLHSYRASKFRSLKRDLKSKPCGTAQSLLRYKLERRIFDCGFSIDTLRPEVTQVIEENKPEVKRRRAHQRLLTMARQQSDFLIRRNQTKESLFSDVVLPPISRERSVIEANRRLLSNS